MAQKKKLTATKLKEILLADKNHNVTYLVDNNDWTMMLTIIANTIYRYGKESSEKGLHNMAESLHETWEYLCKALEPYEEEEV